MGTRQCLVRIAKEVALVAGKGQEINRKPAQHEKHTRRALVGLAVATRAARSLRTMFYGAGREGRRQVCASSARARLSGAYLFRLTAIDVASLFALGACATRRRTTLANATHCGSQLVAATAGASVRVLVLARSAHLLARRSIRRFPAVLARRPEPLLLQLDALNQFARSRRSSSALDAPT